MDLENAQNRIIDFIRDETGRAGVKVVVVVISVGIDSALTATLAVKALGKDRVLGIHMLQSSLTPAVDSEDAEALADWLGIEYRTIDISGIISAFMAAVGERICGQAHERQPESKDPDVPSLFPCKPAEPHGYRDRKQNRDPSRLLHEIRGWRR